LGETTLRTTEEKIRQTLAEFCHRTDAGDYDGWVQLFVENGSIHLLGETYSGHEQLRTFIELDQPPERRGVHLTTDSLIEIDGDVARVRSKFIFVSGSWGAGILEASGAYHDVLVPSGERWLFRERECVLFGRPVTEENESKGGT
jgi:3-phenylpropionate/cinnamic acid dioxygenase small subunit